MIALFWWLLVKLVPFFGLFGTATIGMSRDAVLGTWRRQEKSRGLIWFRFDLRRKIRFE
jgi:hypothetical protein